MSKTYLFVWGTHPQLSVAEVRSLWPAAIIEPILPQIAKISLPEEETADNYSSELFNHPQKMIDLLGGTVKILEVVEILSGIQTPDHQFRPLSNQALEQKIIDYFNAQPLIHGEKKRLKLALAEIGRDHLPPIKIAPIKSTLEGDGWPVRYYQSSRHGLPAAIYLHKSNIQELNLVQNPKNGEIYLALTKSVQDIDDWSFRDRQKPYADHKKGLLPPKIARIMVNLALGPIASRSPEKNHSLTLLDPFCGSGTILMEAAFSEIQLLGSDTDSQAVTGTQKNLFWLNQEYHFEPSLVSQIIVQDATHLTDKDFAEQKINYLVTEPFLGKQTPRIDRVGDVFAGLERLYWGAFKNWTKILSENATLAIVLPTTTNQTGQKLNFNSLIDKAKSLGYTISSGPYEYYRPQAIIQRQIWILKYNHKD